MRRLVRSSVATSWSLSLFAVQEAVLLALAPMSRRAADRAKCELDAVAWKAAASLGPALEEVYQAADSLQRDAWDLAWDSLPRDPLDPAQWCTGGRDLAEATGVTAMRFFVPRREAALAWRELGNKLEVYRLVKQVRQKIGVPPLGGAFDLNELARRAYGLGEYAALWAVEGLGHSWVEHEWQGPEPPRALLDSAAGRSLPQESLTMLHAGIGLGFAQRLLSLLGPDPDATEVRRTVERVTRLCRESSRAGYEGAALESLGLVTRSFHAPLVPKVDVALAEVDPGARDYFWHGVGRALYFLPINFMPCGRVSWRPFEMGDREATDGAAHLNVRAGLGWAFALVNMRQPEIVCRLLAERGEALAADPGFANGVASTAMMRRDTTPGGVLLDAFLSHKPEGEAAPWWSTLVRHPAEVALERVYPGLVRSCRLGEIFRYRTLAELEAAPAGEGPA
jgi:hypothetical protein